jgi:rSAM/selenodomain-associated transferase 1
MGVRAAVHARGRAWLPGAVFYIAAKAPRPGLAKTRLGQAIGHERAAALSGAFLSDWAGRFADAPFEVVWFFTPPDAWPEIAPLVEWTGRQNRTLAQIEGDWTERQRELFRGAAARGEGRVLIAAHDSPHTTVGTVAEAFRLLERHDVVVAPVHDGGYYLLGMRGWHDVLGGVAMSTGSVTQEIVARAEHAGLTVGQLPPTFDVDEAEDLEQLRDLAAVRDDLPATRAVLATIPNAECGVRSAE